MPKSGATPGTWTKTSPKLLVQGSPAREVFPGGRRRDDSLPRDVAGGVPGATTSEVEGAAEDAGVAGWARCVAEYRRATATRIRAVKIPRAMTVLPGESACAIGWEAGCSGAGSMGSGSGSENTVSTVSGTTISGTMGWGGVSRPIHAATACALCGRCAGSLARQAMTIALTSGGTGFSIPKAANRSSIGSGATCKTWWVMSPLWKGGLLVNNS